MTAPKPRHPFHDHDCTACGAPCGWGITSFGTKVEFDLKARVWAIVGDSPLRVTETEMARVAHAEVCPYRNV